MKRIVKFLPVIILFFASACKKDKNDTSNSNIVNFKATLSGATESTPNTSTATGTSTGTFNTATKILSLSTAYSGITPTAGHIHKGEVGVSGPVEFPFVITASPIVYTSDPLSDSDAQDLMEGKLYVNLHSAAYPAGEIRGQLLKQ